LSLDEVRSLLDLGDGRNRRAVQSVTQARLSQIEDKLAQSQEIRAMREEAEAAAQRVEPAGSAPHPVLRVELMNINDCGNDASPILPAPGTNRTRAPAPDRPGAFFLPPVQLRSKGSPGSQDLALFVHWLPTVW
jgi:hypothetical protein